MSRNGFLRLLRSVLIGLLAIATPASVGFPDEGDLRTACRAEITKVIRATGYDGPLTFLRNDAQPLALNPMKWKDQMLFFRIMDAGEFTDEDGRTWFTLGSVHSTDWHVFVDPISCEVFRMYGFSGGNDYSEMARHIKSRVREGEADYIAENYLELTYSPGGSLITSKYEALQFVEDNYYASMGEEGIESCLRPWLKKHYRKIKNSISAPQVEEIEDRFRVKLAFGVSAGVGVVDPVIEIRSLTLDVDRIGDTHIRSEQVLMSFPLDHCR
jgi:hypothetical protein